MKHWKCTVCGHVFETEQAPAPCSVCKAPLSAFVEVTEAPATPVAFSRNTEDSYVIIGGGLAGARAAEIIRSLNSTASITIVTDENHPPYNRPILSRAVAEAMPFDKLALHPDSFYSEHRINLLQGVEARSIDPGNNIVRLSTGDSLSYTRLLFSTGSTPFNPIQYDDSTIPVQALRRFEDADQLANITPGSRVVVVGGGILGLEAALALHSHNCKVTIVEFASRLFSLQADAPTSARLSACLTSLGMQVITGHSVVSASATGAVLDDGTAIPADLILASMGVRSNTALAASIGVSIGRGILVDDKMRTNLPGIWAAGDCAEFDGRVVANASTANAMGKVAGASMAGDTAASYKPAIPATSFSCDGIKIFSVGCIQEDASETALYQNTASGAYRRLFFTEGKLSGAIFVGEGSAGVKSIAAIAQGLEADKALTLLSN